MEMISQHLGRVIPEPSAPVPITIRQSRLLGDLSKSQTYEQVRGALTSLLGLDAASEEP
jgi:hypothetical protein